MDYLEQVEDEKEGQVHGPEVHHLLPALASSPNEGPEPQVLTEGRSYLEGVLIPASQVLRQDWRLYEDVYQGCTFGDGEDPEHMMSEVLWAHVRLCEVPQARSSASCWGFAPASEDR